MDERIQISGHEINGILIMDLSGKIDSVSSNDFEKDLKSRIDAGIAKIILNMGNVTYISSSGLRIVLAALKRVKQSGGMIVLVDLQPGPEEVFKMTGFDRLFPVYRNLDDAIIHITNN